jgi:DNA-binding transcriptional MerR regulator/methylmalonyl-CoA mutase cobalamin-binding subunit
MSPEPRPQFPIRTVAQRTGLSPDVLRAWERRYGAVEPVRDARGVRLYSADDVARFRLLRRLTEEGHAIGRIAALPEAELRDLAGPDPADRPAPRPPSPSAAAQVAAALEAVEALDGARLREALMRAVVALPSREFTEGVVLPLLREVGDRWAAGRIHPAHEHLLSARLAGVLGWLLDAIPAPPGAPEAVAAAPSGERHELGALLAAVAAAEEGWRVTYLGADLPAADVALAAQARRARVVLLSVLLEDEAESTLAAVRTVRAALGDGPRILVGGPGAARAAEAIGGAGGTWLGGFDALRAALGELHPGDAAG